MQDYGIELENDNLIKQELEIDVEPESFIVKVNYKYPELEEKPSINGTELNGDLTLKELGIQPEGNYALKEEIPDVSEFITKDVDNLTNYTDTNELNSLLNLKANKKDIPTKVSQLTNDSLYIDRSVNDLENYQNNEELEKTLAEKADVSSIPTNLSQLTNDSDYAKNSDIPTKVSQLTNDNNYIDKNVDNLKNYTKTEIMNTLLSTKADKSAIPTKTSQLQNDSDFITSSAIPTSLSEFNNDTGFITDESVPKNVSELVNDTGFITKDNLPTKLSELENDTSYAKTSQLPTKTSELTNDSNFITNLVDNLLNYYKKTETYSRTEVNDLVSSLQAVKIKKVDVRPEKGETNIIYFVLNTQNPQEENYYDEFMYFEDAWEKIGTTKVDLSDYQTSEELEQLLSNYVKSEDFTKVLAKKLDINSSEYIKNISIEGKTITYTKGDDTTGELITQDTTYPEATTTKNGLMSATDKSKLDNINVPTNVSQLTNDTGFITKKDLPTKTSQLENNSDYITSADIPTNLSQLANDSGYAKTTEIPTAVSELENDAGYISSYKETDPTVPSYVKAITTDNISAWNNKAEKSAIPTKVSQLTNDSKFCKVLQANSEEDAITKSAADPTNIYYWIEE